MLTREFFTQREGEMPFIDAPKEADRIERKFLRAARKFESCKRMGWRGQMSRAQHEMNTVMLEAKDIASKLGKQRKREKEFRKRHRLMTYTEFPGIEPWRVWVKKEDVPN